MFDPDTLRKMQKKRVHFLFVQIDEAHSTMWPLGPVSLASAGLVESSSSLNNSLNNSLNTTIDPSTGEVLPQKSLDDRILRAQQFMQVPIVSAALAMVDSPIKVAVDTWDNEFGNRLHAWPDVYYLVDLSTKLILARSTYGMNADALIDIECLDLLDQL